MQLNAAQEKVLNTSEKRILVLAGPGTGKTLVLKEWIKKQFIVDKRKSYKILGLTFTNKAAQEMKSRLSEDDMEDELKRVHLMTFHGFGTRVLRQYGYYLGVSTDFDICNDVSERLEILKVGVRNANINGEYNWKKCLKFISFLKKEGFEPSEGELKTEKFETINAIYTAYETELKSSNYLDYDDLLLKSYKLLKEYNALRKHYQRIFSKICIDELQDTNKIQYKILECIINNHTNLLAVGDDNQVIYEWNGADYQRLKTFKEDYKPSIIHLPLNYRCPEKIVYISNKLMMQNELRLGIFQPNKSCSSKGEVKVSKFDTFENEVSGVVDNILKHHLEELGQVTILARRKKLLDEVVKELNERNVAYRLYSRKDKFISAPLVWLNAILHLFNSPNRERSMKAVIGSFNQMANLDIELSLIKKIKQKENNVSLFSSWLNRVNILLGNNEKGFKDLILLIETQLSIKTYKHFYNKVLQWFDNFEHENSKEVIQEQVYSYDEYREEKEVWKDLSKEIFNRLGNEIPLSSFLQEMALCSKATSAKPNEINLMTIHASKGQGFDYVYLIGMVNDELPSYHALKSNKKEVIEEERRNCYVGITRASKELTLTYADRYFTWDKKPSQFLTEMELL